jgi:hypothetical protein
MSAQGPEAPARIAGFQERKKSGATPNPRAPVLRWSSTSRGVVASLTLSSLGGRGWESGMGSRTMPGTTSVSVRPISCIKGWSSSEVSGRVRTWNSVLVLEKIRLTPSRTSAMDFGWSSPNTQL